MPENDQRFAAISETLKQLVYEIMCYELALPVGNAETHVATERERDKLQQIMSRDWVTTVLRDLTTTHIMHS